MNSSRGLCVSKQKLTLLGTLALAVVASQPAFPGKSDVHRKQVEDRLQQGFDIAHNKNTGDLEIGGKGRQRKSFNGKARHEGAKLSVELASKNNPGRRGRLEYDENTRTVILGAGGQDVRVQINPDKTVTAGQFTCKGDEPACIANAVIAAMPNLDAEEVGALLAAGNDELHEMQFGDHISASLVEVAARLHMKARKP